MKPFTALIAILLLALLISPVAGVASGFSVGDPPPISPELSARLASLAPDEMIPVLVTLCGDSALPSRSSLSRLARPARLNAVVSSLRRQAEDCQAPLLPRLQAWEASGQARDLTRYWIFNGLALTATPGVIEELARLPQVRSIRLDASIPAPRLEDGMDAVVPDVQPNLDLVGATALWDLGYMGQGVVVANVDTGVALDHPDLRTRWRGGSNSWLDATGEFPDLPTDINGHGTATMGIVAGGSAGGSAIGLAPRAQWIAARIFHSDGYALFSYVHEAYQWLLDPDGDPQTADAPHVVNNSWTFSAPVCSLEFQPDVQALLAAGILPIFAAGNHGPQDHTDTSLGNYPESFAVGSINMDGVIHPGSSRGPSACGEADTIYPEIVAPGVAIHTANQDGGYHKVTGTSMAAPHVSGGLALLLSAFPSTSVEQQRAALLNTALDLGPAGPDNSYGFGRLDLLAAYAWLQENYVPPTPTLAPTITPTPRFTPPPTVLVTPTPEPPGRQYSLILPLIWYFYTAP